MKRYFACLLQVWQFLEKVDFMANKKESTNANKRI